MEEYILFNFRNNLNSRACFYFNENADVFDICKAKKFKSIKSAREAINSRFEVSGEIEHIILIFSDVDSISHKSCEFEEVVNLKAFQ